jgi:hypothetical protein
LALKFAQDGLAEHASISSFASFSLQLMAVGAPAKLISRAHLAALDEVKHAQMSFDLASMIDPDHSPYSPSPFHGEKTLTMSSNKLQMCVAAAKEGCVDEMISTLIAAIEIDLISSRDCRSEFFGHSSEIIDEVIRVKSTIVEDESRHAVLAWDTIEWCVQSSTSTGNERESMISTLKKAIEDEAQRHLSEGLIRQLGLGNRVSHLLLDLFKNHHLEAQQSRPHFNFENECDCGVSSSSSMMSTNAFDDAISRIVNQ